MPPALTPIAPVTSDAVEFEQNNVHTVYDAIADHFSSTRYKPWPVIANFMSSLAAGSVGIDSGCGNGKYLPLGTPNVLTVGLDRSANLLKIAHRAGDAARDVALGDALDDCWRAGCFVRCLAVC